MLSAWWWGLILQYWKLGHCCDELLLHGCFSDETNGKHVGSNRLHHRRHFLTAPDMDRRFAHGLSMIWISKRSNRQNVCKLSSFTKKFCEICFWGHFRWEISPVCLHFVLTMVGLCSLLCVSRVVVLHVPHLHKAGRFQLHVPECIARCCTWTVNERCENCGSSGSVPLDFASCSSRLSPTFPNHPLCIYTSPFSQGSCRLSVLLCAFAFKPPLNLT